MLDRAGVHKGSHVLDVAAGAGEQSLVAARRVGPSGHVLATDISSNILEYCLANARAEGLGNVETRVLDAEKASELGEDVFDAAISRLGLMYFPDKQGSLEGLRRALKPEGKVAVLVFSTPDENAFFSVPIGIIRRRAQLGPPAPGQPGPFSVGAPGVLKETLEKAGFRDVTVERISTPLKVASTEECVQFEKESFGALHQMMAGLSDEEKAATWEEITGALRAFENVEGFSGPCVVLVGAGTK
jgi:ubiquinone/menaquinone biosynthesis C-methylase UbiE